MALSLLTNAEKALPAAADGVSVTPNASAWANSNYTELVASAPTAGILTGIVVRVAANFIDTYFEVDIATGAAASETVIATFRGSIATFQDQREMQTIRSVIGVANIANGARVAARIRTSGTTVTAWNISALYIAGPLTGPSASRILTTTSLLRSYPAAADSISVTCSSTPWTASSYGQILASAAADLVIVGVVAALGSFGTAGEIEIDIATGAAASEVVKTTVRRRLNGNSEYPSYIPLWLPLDNIASGARVAARARSSIASSVVKIGLMGFQKPL